MCNSPFCKFIDFIEISEKIKICLHYNEDKEPIYIQFWNDNTCFKRSFTPKIETNFIELNHFLNFNGYK